MRRRDQDAEGIEGELRAWEGGAPSRVPTRVSGSVVSSPSGALTKNEFWCINSLKEHNHAYDLIATTDIFDMFVARNSHIHIHIHNY